MPWTDVADTSAVESGCHRSVLCGVADVVDTPLFNVWNTDAGSPLCGGTIFAVFYCDILTGAHVQNH